MLKLLRKHTKIIIWAVVITFILWGGFSVGVSFKDKGRVAGEAFGKKVTLQEFNLYYNLARFYTPVDRLEQDPGLVTEIAWQSLIYAQEAKKQGVEITDNEVRAEITQLMALHKLINPSAELYKKWVNATFKITPQQFEQMTREALRIRKFIAMVQSAPIETPSDEVIRNAYFMEKNTLSAEAVTFPNKTDAQAFRTLASDEATWNHLITERKLTLIRAKELSLVDFVNEWQILPEVVLNLHQSSLGTITDPVESGFQYAIFRMIDKYTEPESSFTNEIAKETLGKIQQAELDKRWMMWNLELLQKARLKDYMKAPSSQDEATTSETA